MSPEKWFVHSDISAFCGHSDAGLVWSRDAIGAQHPRAGTDSIYR